MPPPERTGPGDRRTIPLDEHETVEEELPEVVARQIAELAGHRLSVGHGPGARTWRIRSTRYVGTLVTPQVDVLVRPKIPIENLFFLLNVDLPKVAWGSLPFGYSTTPDLLPAFAMLYIRTLDQALGHGLVRSYRAETERLVAIRGRVLVNQTFRTPATPVPAPCSFDEYTADNDENRYLKAATARLWRTPDLRPETRQTLARQLSQFEEVADTEPPPETLDQIVFTRLNRHYRPALRLARLVLENLSLVNWFGGFHAASFLLDMDKVFQNWVTDRLRHHLRGRLAVDDEPKVLFDARGDVRMHPDLRFRRRDDVVYVADVKYKVSRSKGLAERADYYQLLAYTTAMGLDEGLLISCKSEGDVRQHEIVVRSAGTRLRTCALDLRGDRTAIDAAVADLAELIVLRART